MTGQGQRTGIWRSQQRARSTLCPACLQGPSRSPDFEDLSAFCSQGCDLAWAKHSHPGCPAPHLLHRGLILLTLVPSCGKGWAWRGLPSPLREACFQRGLLAMSCALSTQPCYESEFGSPPPTLEFWKSRYFSRLEEDEKLAVPICSWFLEVRSVRFRDSLNISVYKISLDHLEWKCGGQVPGVGFFFISFIWELGVLALQGSGVIKLKCSE